MNVMAEFDRHPVPIIDLSPSFSGGMEEKRAIAAQIDRACRTIGFLVISGHGVSGDLIRQVREAATRFFDLPEEIKQLSASKSPEVYRGYSVMGAVALAKTIGENETGPDYREGFSINRHRIDRADSYYTSEAGRGYFHDNIYPEYVPELKPLLEAYYDAMEGLASRLMSLFAIALGVDENWFADKIDKHITGLNLSNYPEQVEAPARGQLRAGAHTDYGSLTILLAEDKPGGLEVRTPDMRWVGVPIVPDAFIVNIGDLMAQWTNDAWVSTMHRVANPPRDATGSTRRQSIAFFHQPNYDAIIECIPTCVGDGARYAPITSGDHLMMKIRQMTLD